MRDRCIGSLRRLVERQKAGWTVYIFGSVMYSAVPKDVDLIVISRQKKLRSSLSRFRRRFQIVHRLRLHIQIFHVNQVPTIGRFFRRCGPKLRIG